MFRNLGFGDSFEGVSAFDVGDDGLEEPVCLGLGD
jgi:hypothetical protein